MDEAEGQLHFFPDEGAYVKVGKLELFEKLQISYEVKEILTASLNYLFIHMFHHW